MYYNSANLHPGVLWKYYSQETFFNHVLKNGHLSLRWSSPLFYNDPFDCQIDSAWERHQPDFPMRFAKALLSELLTRRPSERARPEMAYFYNKLSYGADAHDELIEFAKVLAKKFATEPMNHSGHFASHLRVFCLSEHPRNIAMWSHYAMKHTGIVVGFDVDSLLKTWDPKGRYLHKVKYRDRMPAAFAVVESMVLDLVGRSLVADPGRVQETFTVKSSDWKYEDEWRFIHLPSTDEEIVSSFDTPRGMKDNDNLHEIVDAPINSIVAFMLGCQMSDKDRQKTLALLAENGFSNTKMYEMRKSRINYGMECFPTFVPKGGFIPRVNDDF